MLSGLAFTGDGAAARIADFRFSQGALRDDEIFDSALAVPGRYMAEIARRLLAGAPEADFLVLANPLLPLRGAMLRVWVPDAPASPWIGTDEAGFPLFYCVPRRLAAEFERFLLLLSAQDGALDADLIGAVLGEAVATRQFPIGRAGPPPAHGPNGWLNGDLRLDALKLQADRALRIIRTRSDWQKIPFAIYYPMHAGDVLFVAVASNRVETTPFTRQVVCTSYADIPDACGSALETVPLKLPWISRDGSVSESDYFTRALARLGPAADENFIVFSRILRLYYRTPFHLVDHARFALGQSFTAFGQTLHGSDNGAHARCARPAAPLKVLFHLNGGWGLKTYPKASIETVIRTLGGMGIESSVLGRPDLAEAGATSFDSEDSATLKRLVEAHHLFVGVDSFPHHFARLRLGWPVIGLFGNTKPTNSDASYRDDYRTSEQYLSCNRCGAYDRCPVFGGTECINYAPPDTVVTDILAMAGRLYGYRPDSAEGRHD
jgi:hypothetical protein